MKLQSMAPMLRVTIAMFGAILLFLVGAFGGGGQCLAAVHRLADSLQHKLDHIKDNGNLDRPDPSFTVISEEEVNDYLAAGRAKLPPGIQAVVFEGQAGVVTAIATVDFDQIWIGPDSLGPPAIFNGSRHVRVEFSAAGVDGQAKVDIRACSIDGKEVSSSALASFLRKYIAPKYPKVGMSMTFSLPNRIDLAAIGYHKLRVRQR